MHRVEVLRQGRTDDFEFWTNTDGTVYLCREHEAEEWQAIVDGKVIVDLTNPLVQAAFTHPVKPLTAGCVSGLVPLLAMQERLHVILDHHAVAKITA